MPGSLRAWYTLNDLAALGDRGSVLSGELATKELERLNGLLCADRHSTIAASLRFETGAGGQAIARLQYKATLHATCQRCLEPVAQPIDETVVWAFVGTEAEAASVPDDTEVMTLRNDRFQPAALLEDELILALPLVPRHRTVAECGALAQNLDDPASDREPERTTTMLEGH